MIVNDDDVSDEQKKKIETAITYSTQTPSPIIIDFCPKTKSTRGPRNTYYSVLYGSNKKSYYIRHGRVTVTYNSDKRTHYCDCGESKCVHSRQIIM